MRQSCIVIAVGMTDSPSPAEHVLHVAVDVAVVIIGWFIRPHANVQTSCDSVSSDP